MPSLEQKPPASPAISDTAKIIAFSSPVGGAGRTSAVRGLAATLLHQDAKVEILDLDGQQTLCCQLAAAGIKNLKVFSTEQENDAFRTRADWLLVDCGVTLLSSTLLQIIDHVIVPVHGVYESRPLDHRNYVAFCQVLEHLAENVGSKKANEMIHVLPMAYFNHDMEITSSEDDEITDLWKIRTNQLHPINLDSRIPFDYFNQKLARWGNASDYLTDMIFFGRETARRFTLEELFSEPDRGFMNHYKLLAHEIETWYDRPLKSKIDIA